MCFIPELTNIRPTSSRDLEVENPVLFVIIIRMESVYLVDVAVLVAVLVFVGNSFFPSSSCHPLPPESRS